MENALLVTPGACPQLGCRPAVACSALMKREQFWALIDTARGAVRDPSDDEAVASRAVDVLSGHPHQEIAAAQQAFWDLMAESYRTELWAAAYEINGGCSDDLFEYFRGWLILQGRAVFERV